MEAAARRRALYLAGPDVFSREAAALGERKKAVCAAFGFEGLYPLDSEISNALDHDAARRAIFDANIALIDRSDAILANITPFKGRRLRSRHGVRDRLRLRDEEDDFSL